MYECKILADSIAAGVRLTTMQVTFPRIVLAEFNTHRDFSRNSASSRAIPVEKQILKVMEDPFIPTYWGKNQKGMQAEEELDAAARHWAVEWWLSARNEAVQRVERMLKLGVHKQITNRLLEPFMWHTVIVTATRWANFFALRCNPQAQPEIRTIAEMMREAYEAGSPSEALEVGEWHLPFITDEDRAFAEERVAGDPSTGWHQAGHVYRLLARLSCARCARVSYLTHDGRRAPEEDLALHDRLLASGHMSPFEHAAVVADADGFVDDVRIRDFGNFDAPWVQYRKLIPGESVFKGGAQ